MIIKWLFFGNIVYLLPCSVICGPCASRSGRKWHYAGANKQYSLKKSFYCPIVRGYWPMLFSIVTSLLFVVFIERSIFSSSRNLLFWPQFTDLITTAASQDFRQENGNVQYCFELKVAGYRFQHFQRLRFRSVIITNFYQLMLQSWCQTNAQWLVNTLLSFSLHNMLP